MTTIVALRPVLLSHDLAGSPPLEWVGGYIDTWDAALVEVTLDDGTTGLGEVAQGIMGAVAVPGIVAGLAPYAVGIDATAPGDVADALRDRTVFWARGAICSGVIAAIEQALWDAAGKASGRPVHELMGGRRHPDVEVYASGGLGLTVESVIEWATAQEADGFTTVKFRAMRTPGRTIELVAAVVASLAPGTRFVLDAVQGCASRPWSWDDAVAVGRAAADHGARWYEEPCRAEDVDGYAEVRRRVTVPVSGVESYASAHEFATLMAREGVDVVQPDAAMVGGPTELQRVAEAARARGLAVVPHVWGTGVTLMANLHTAFATPGMELVELCTLANPLREALLAQPLERVGDRVAAPTAPGLGVALTPEIEARFAFQPGRGHVIT